MTHEEAQAIVQSNKQIAESFVGEASRQILLTQAIGASMATMSQLTAVSQAVTSAIVKQFEVCETIEDFAGVLSKLKQL